MKNWKKVLALGLVGVVAAGAFAGCGDEKKPAASGAASSAAGQKVAVKAYIGSDEPPLTWKDEKGELHGYEYEVLKAVDSKLKNFKLDIDAVPGDTVDVLMESGEAQLAAGGYYKNKQREENFLLPENPTGVSAITIYVREGDEKKYKNIDDIVANHLKIVPCSPNGGIFRTMTEWNNAHGNPLPEIPVQAGQTNNERLLGLQSGQWDALIIPNNLGVLDDAAKAGVKIVALPEPMKINPTYLLINKKEDKLAKEVNDALGELRKDGTLSKLSEKYYKEDFFKLLDKK